MATIEHGHNSTSLYWDIVTTTFPKNSPWKSQSIYYGSSIHSSTVKVEFAFKEGLQSLCNEETVYPPQNCSIQFFSKKWICWEFTSKLVNLLELKNWSLKKFSIFFKTYHSFIAKWRNSVMNNNDTMTLNPTHFF